MGAEIIAGAIVGAASLAAAGVSASSASSTNESSQNFAAAQNGEARLFAERMYNKQFAEGNAEYDRRQAKANANSRELTEWMYKNFNSPAAQVAALRKAGLNPAAAFGSGGSGFSQQLMESAQPAVSSPSGFSAPVQSPVGLQNPYQSFNGAIGQIASAFADLQAGTKSASEARTIERTRDAVLKEMVLKNSGQEIANEFAKFHLNLDKAFSDRKIRAEIKKLESEAVNAYYSGKHQKAMIGLTDLQSKLAEYSHKCNQAMLPHLQENVKQIVLGYKLENEIKKTSADSNKAMASASYASAGLAKAQTQTENERRPYVISIDKNQALDIANRAKISSADMEKALLELQKTRNIAAWRKKWPNLSREIDEFRYITGSDVGKTASSGGNGMSVLAGYLLKALK